MVRLYPMIPDEPDPRGAEQDGLGERGYLRGEQLIFIGARIAHGIESVTIFGIRSLQPGLFGACRAWGDQALSVDRLTVDAIVSP